jgi:phage regulator Rha-like protein
VNFESSLNTKIESDFKSDSKRQKGGRETLYCHLNEDQATFLITLFRNTPTVLEFKCRLVEEFRNALDEINRLYANPPRQGIIQEKRDAHGLMMNALIELRSEQGKETNPAHFMCENKLCNGVVTGNYAKADESGLSNADIELLAQVRKRNEAFLMSGLDYQERKKRLIAFAMKHRTKLIG